MCPHMQAATQNQASPKILGSTCVFILEEVSALCQLHFQAVR